MLCFSKDQTQTWARILIKRQSYRFLCGMYGLIRRLVSISQSFHLRNQASQVKSTWRRHLIKVSRTSTKLLRIRRFVIGSSSVFLCIMCHLQRAEAELKALREAEEHRNNCVCCFKPNTQPFMYVHDHSLLDSAKSFHVASAVVTPAADIASQFLWNGIILRRWILFVPCAAKFKVLSRQFPTMMSKIGFMLCYCQPELTFLNPSLCHGQSNFNHPQNFSHSLPARRHFRNEWVFCTCS